jgi:hypothetical protein
MHPPFCGSCRHRTANPTIPATRLLWDAVTGMLPFEPEIASQVHAYVLSENITKVFTHLTLHRVLAGSAFLVPIVLAAVPALAQREHGEIRLQVRDPKGGPVVASGELANEIDQIQRRVLTDQDGLGIIRELPFGVYRLRVSHQGFVPTQSLIDVRSEVPLAVSVPLGLAPIESRIEVTDGATLIDPKHAAFAYAIGPITLNQQIPAQMGHSITDAVDSEPGWLYEANGVLHPRGSEYGVQFVVNGLPLTENRSPAFAPALEADDVESMRVMTAGFPAEYGRKLGGVVEVTTAENLPPGFHMAAAAEGGSFQMFAGVMEMGYARGRSQFLLTGDGGFTGRYLDPPVIANYTNHGSTGGFTKTYLRDLTDRDRLRVCFRRDAVRYLVPNELVQQEAGQRQDAAATEGQRPSRLRPGPISDVPAEC